MTLLDERIIEALDEKEREFWDAHDDPAYMILGVSQFYGKNAWVSWVMMVTQALFFFLGIWCAIKFYAATEVLSAVKYGITMAVLFVLAFQMKMSFMPKMQADRILRALKRVELLVLRAK